MPLFRRPVRHAGVGEVGTIPPGAAVANAVCDALADHWVELHSLPVTRKLWGVH